jgi:hypothetical protein
VVTAENNGVTYVVSSELAAVSAQSRRHFGAVHGDGDTLRTAFGETWADLIPGGGISLSANQWYYVALTFEPNASNRNVVNAYVANLTAGDEAATHTLVNLNTNATAGPVTAPTLGLGCFGSASANYSHFYGGFVDQVSIYGSPLSHADVNAHVAAIQQKPDLRVDLDVFRNYPSVDPNWVPDTSSWQNDAILGQSPTTTTKNPSRGQYGFYFDPSAADGGQMLTLNRNESLRVADIGNGQDMSIEMWLNADALNSALVDTRHTNYSGWLMTVRDNGSVWMRFYEAGNANNWTVESDPELVKTDGRYQHVVMSLDANESGGGTATFYVNGQEWGTSAYSDALGYIDPATAPFRIGHKALGISTSVVPFHGEISGFALYAKALDHGEVLARFALGVPEPATAVMALFGAMFLLATRRRARSAV